MWGNHTLKFVVNATSVTLKMLLRCQDGVRESKTFFKEMREIFLLTTVRTWQRENTVTRVLSTEAHLIVWSDRRANNGSGEDAGRQPKRVGTLPQGLSPLLKWQLLFTSTKRKLWKSW